MKRVGTTRLFDAAAVLTTPLVPDDYLGQLNPLWSTREPCGRVDAVVAETRDCVTLWLRPGRGWRGAGRGGGGGAPCRVGAWVSASTPAASATGAPIPSRRCRGAATAASRSR